MNYIFSHLPKSAATITVEMPFSEFEPHLMRAAVLISEEIDIEGFRRGKAPYEIIKNRVGEMALYERAADGAVRKTYSEILQKVSDDEKNKGHHFIPIGKPEVTITKLAIGGDFAYTIRLSLIPEVRLPDYRAIASRTKKEKKEISVAEEEVTQGLEWIRDSRAPLITVARQSQKGDRVEIDVAVLHAGASIPGAASRNHPFEIGKGSFIPGFEDHIVGMKAGESKNFSLNVPENWHDKNLAGKLLEFAVTTKIVQEKQKPALDDEFAKSVGNFASLDELRSNIRNGIHEEKEGHERERIRALIVQNIAEESSMEIPEVLVQSEIEKMLRDLQSGVGTMGIKWEDYLLHLKKTEEEMKKDWHKDAEKRVRAALTLRAVAEKEHVTVAETEVEEHANQLLKKYRSAEKAEKDIDPEELHEYTRGVLRNEKVLELLENT